MGNCSACCGGDDRGQKVTVNDVTAPQPDDDTAFAASLGTLRGGDSSPGFHVPEAIPEGAGEHEKQAAESAQPEEPDTTQWGGGEYYGAAEKTPQQEMPAEGGEWHSHGPTWANGGDFPQREEAEEPQKAEALTPTEVVEESVPTMRLTFRDPANGAENEFEFRSRPLGIDFQKSTPLRVGRVQPNTAAAECGVMPGSLLICINGENVASMGLAAVQVKLRDAAVKLGSRAQ